MSATTTTLLEGHREKTVKPLKTYGWSQIRFLLAHRNIIRLQFGIQANMKYYFFFFLEHRVLVTVCVCGGSIFNLDIMDPRRVLRDS